MTKADFIKYYDMCCEVSRVVQPKASPDYIRRAVHLLMGTAAQESGFIHWRQLGFPLFPVSSRGAFGLWQCESRAIVGCMEFIRKNATLKARYLAFMDAHYPTLDLCSTDVREVIQDKEGDFLACLLARIYYWNCPGLIPPTLEGQAAYWKKYYNTVKGKGTVEQYMKSWRRHILPHIL